MGNSVALHNSRSPDCQCRQSRPTPITRALGLSLGLQPPHVMVFMILVYYLLQMATGEAVPVPSVRLHSRAAPDPSTCLDIDDCRTKKDIIVGCLSTVLLCTWVSLRPNISFAETAEDDATWFRRTISIPARRFGKYKLPLFLCAVFVPEYILGWAMRQYFNARYIQKRGVQ